MQGIVFFSIYSFGDEFWSTADILASLDHLEELAAPIKASTFSEVKTPSDWTDIAVAGETIFDLLQKASGYDQQLFGETLNRIFNNLLKQVPQSNTSFAGAIVKLQTTTISIADNEYYLALKSSTDWPDIEGALNVSSPSDLYQNALVCLREAPVSEANYIERCGKVFSKLLFHPDVGETLKRHGQSNAKAKYAPARVQGIRGFSHSITDALSALNEIELQGKTTDQILCEVQSRSGFECSKQGKDKAKLRFSYNDGTQEEKLNCEFHIKIHKDNDDAATYFQDRIYFGFCGEDDEKRIFVAHSGQHL